MNTSHLRASFACQSWLGFALASVIVIATAVSASANGQVPAGGTGTVTPNGGGVNPSSPAWQIKFNTSPIADANSTNGWSLVYNSSSGTVQITAPSTATVSSANNYS